MRPAGLVLDSTGLEHSVLMQIGQVGASFTEVVGLTVWDFQLVFHSHYCSATAEGYAACRSHARIICKVELWLAGNMKYDFIALNYILVASDAQKFPWQ